MQKVGYGKQPPLRVVQQLAKQANFSNWKHAKEEIGRIVDAISQWPTIASDLGVSKSAIKIIAAQLNTALRQNRHLLES